MPLLKNIFFWFDCTVMDMLTFEISSTINFPLAFKGPCPHSDVFNRQGEAGWDAEQI